jgi:aminopeptidase YwaD
MKQHFRYTDESTNELFQIASQLLNKYTYRITGTEVALKAGEAIKEMFDISCQKSTLEPFRVYPGQLWNIGKILTSIYLISAVAYWFGIIGIYVSICTILLGLVYGFSHFILYSSVFDKLFVGKNAHNAVGIIEPSNTVKQQIIIVGHHDSPYVFRYLLKHQSLYGLIMALSIGSYLFGVAISIYRFLFFIINGYVLHNYLLTILILVLSIVIMPLFFFITKEPSPGAGDNLIGSVITIRLSQIFSKNNPMKLNLEKTRLVFLSSDAEEVGQRGAKSYIQKHRMEIENTQTFVLNIDSIYNYDDLTLLKRDRNGLVGLSKLQNEKCIEIAKQLGIDVKLKSIPLGGGGTDGSWFVNNKTQVISIIGMPMDFKNKTAYYHTPVDTLDKIEPKAVKSVIDLAVNYILDLDSPI